MRQSERMARENRPTTASPGTISSVNSQTAIRQSDEELDAVCDRATLDELRAEGDNLLHDLVAVFLTELTKGLDQLAHALEVRDCAAIARIAHTLKGSAGTFGAARMHQMAARIEQAANGGQADETNAMFGDFRAECERVRKYLLTQVA